MRSATKLVLFIVSFSVIAKEKKSPPPSPIEDYVAAARANLATGEASPGSLYIPGARFSDLARDVRASQIGDLVTILVSDQASAVSRGATSSSRKSSAKAGIPALWGPRAAALGNLANLSSDAQLDGAGSTSRSNTLTTTLTARIVDVLPNGFLVVEGIKEVQANSEKQRVTIRGVIRWNDISPRNTIASDRVGQLQIHIDGKGVVADATRRPNILYRILLGVLPF